MAHQLCDPLQLAHGPLLPNRIAKAAMEESLVVAGQVPGHKLWSLYRRWGASGAGLLITGNVMVHSAAMTSPAGVVLDDKAPLEPFRRLAGAAKNSGSLVWMQINHPGRQVMANMPGVAWAPSALAVNVGRNTKLFAHPVAMTAQQISETIDRFVLTAHRAEQSGFDGVEVHAAHGYLLSQFLSPLTNQRTDEWGGSLENRARLLTTIVTGIRSQASSHFQVAVKINSADFQRGGFEANDAQRVISLLAPLGVDLVELSGGNYESPAMMAGSSADPRTHAREAYFLDLATTLAHSSPLPLMLTGGIVRKAVAQKVLDSGVTMVGIGSALALNPDLLHHWASDHGDPVSIPPVRIADKSIASAAAMARVRSYMRSIVRGKTPRVKKSPRVALAVEYLRDAVARRRYTRWLRRQQS